VFSYRAATGEVANAIGIAKPTVYSTITKLKRDGVVASQDGGLRMAPQATVSA
jgi:Mn-dependent DtxR family transcriptional regulator